MAEKIIISAVAGPAGSVAKDSIGPYIGYFFKYGTIVKDFKKQRRELELKKTRIKGDVDEAMRQTEVIEEDVKDWLERAEKVLNETQSSENEIERKCCKCLSKKEKESEGTQSLENEVEHNNCFSWCPSWGWRYCLSKKLAKKTVDMSELLKSGDFPRVGRRAPLEGIEFLLSKGFKLYESSKATFDGIMKALKSDVVSMIGLYGMPGVGKTTLAEEVGKLARKQCLFDKVVKVTMSQTPYDRTREIQDKIAEILGLKFEVNTEEGRAEELLRRLNGEKTMLIIIDDLWDEIELASFGIEFSGEHKGCKFLLTTRREQVCIQMNCQEKFQLNILSVNEAWALFKDTAGLKDASDPTFNNVAKAIAGECKGLPLAIVTIAKALKGASLAEWKAAERQLKDSRHLDNQHLVEGIHKCLNFSYDYLKEDSIKSCFLLCSIFPEDCDISVEMLTICGIGEGLFCDVVSMEELRIQICAALTRLQKSGLLLETDRDDFVRMHDVVRDFAHWLTSIGENMFMVKDGYTEWPMNIRNFGCYRTISLWNCNLSYLPDRLEFSNLKTLILMGKSSFRVSSTFFERMNTLQVLVLKNVIFSLEALQFLANLRILYCEECKLENDMSWLGNPRNLEILALFDTDILELPVVLVELQRLKSLYFSYRSYYSPKLRHNFRGKQINFPPKLLSRLTSLQELHTTIENLVNIRELSSLPHLTALSLRVSTNRDFQESFMFFNTEMRSTEYFPQNFVFPKLNRYKIVINGNLANMEGLTSRTLEFIDFSSSLCAFKELFCNVEKLTLKNVTRSIDMKCLIDTTTQEESTDAFSNLVELKIEGITSLQELCHGQPPTRFLQNVKEVSVKCCGELQYVFQSEIRQLSNLTSLHLDSLPALKGIWEEPITYSASLRSLKLVTVKFCHELIFVFSPYFAQSLLHLQQLEVIDCDGLEQVFDFGQETTDQLDTNITTTIAEIQALALSNLTSLHLRYLDQLRSVWNGPTNPANLQSLKTLEMQDCPELASLFPPSLAQTLVHLEHLSIRSCESLEYLIIEVENEDEVVSNPNTLCWPKLRTLKIKYCKSLRYVFPITLAQGLPCLESVEINMCRQLRQFFDMAKEKSGQDIRLQSLKLLELRDLPNLSHFCPENLVVSSLYLKSFVVYNCPLLIRSENARKGILQQLQKLTLFGGEMVSLYPSLQNLREVAIWCEKLQEVYQIDELLQDREENQPPLLSNLTRLTLKFLPELKWILKGPTHYVSLQGLKIVEISYCPGLKYLFSRSIAQSLVLLQQLTIDNCKDLEHIIKELETDDAILHPPLLPKVTTLHLRNLTNLNSFSSYDNYLIMLPALEKLTFCNCPKLENFTIQIENDQIHLKELGLWDLGQDMGYHTINFQIIKQSSVNLEPVRTVNCDEIFDIQAGRILIGVEHSEPHDIHQLQGPNEVASLRYLKELKPSNSNRSKSLFPPMVARNLQDLTVLEIRGCEELEEIIEMDKMCASSSRGHHLRQPISFPRLQRIHIDGCCRLKSLFPFSVIRFLPDLVSISICGPCELEQVFGYPGESYVEGNKGDEKKIWFTELKKLLLKELPSLTSFAPMGSHLLFPLMERLEVTGCPKFTTSFSKDPKSYIVHAISKAPQQVQNDTTESTEIVSDNQATSNDILWKRYGISQDIPAYFPSLTSLA